MTAGGTVRRWTPPEGRVAPGQLQLPGCEGIDAGRVVAELVEFWTERYVTNRADFYLRPKRQGVVLACLARLAPPAGVP